MLTLQRNAWAPRTSQLMPGQHSELFASLVVSEMFLTDELYEWVRNDKKTNLGSVVPNESNGLRDPSARSNKQIVATCRDKTNQDKGPNGCVKPMLTLSESTFKKVAPRSVESALSISTAAFRIRTRSTHGKQPHSSLSIVEVHLFSWRKEHVMR